VGTEEPIATGTISQAVGGVANSTSIQYRNTGRIVTIIPQVNSQGLVNLQILAEVSQLRKDLVKVGQDDFPAFDSRQAETTAVVQDGDTLAIGGIITDSKSRTRNGIPYLMDIPVIGRFFGTTSDEVSRTELIMMITPHVIRSRAEAFAVTDEFKSKISLVRSELERLEQDRAKLRPAPRPQALPPMPDPNQYYKEEPPQPAPSSDLPSGGTPPAPSASSSPLPFDKVPARSPFGGLNQAIDSRSAAPLEGRADDRAGNFQISERNPGVVKPTPQSFALALVPARGEAAATAKKPDDRAGAAKAKRLWAVQVAALAEQKDAESLAGKLRQEGYQAYVQTNQTDAKTWHRVRVGHFEKRHDADELKKTLATNEAYRNAYVAPN
jgi:cell division septation protein DedD